MYVVLAPLAENIGEVGFEAIRALVTMLILVAVCLFILRYLLHDSLKAALLTSGGLLLFGTYGHITRLFEQSIMLPDWSILLLAFFWIMLMVGWAYWVTRRMQDPALWNTYLNAVGGILVIFPLFSIATYTRNTPVLEENVARYREHMLSQAGVKDLDAALSLDEPARDIYYIILDGYTREDVLKELYDYDNSDFLSSLEHRGFFIPANSRANYPSTVYSLASSLNMSHIYDSPDVLRSGIDSDQEAVLRDALGILIHDNRVAEFLREQGYEFVAFDSGFTWTTITTADTLAGHPDISRVNPEAAFELMVINSTLGKAFLRLTGEEFVPIQSVFDDHRGRILFALEHIADFAQHAGPQFVFVHVVSPHSPYVFDAQGEPRYGVDPFTLLEQPTVGEWSPSLYTDQVTFVNSMILKRIDEILANSEPAPIIILQADHSSNLAWRDQYPPPEIRDKLLFPIFAAFYLPDGDDAVKPYPEISPVNVFRLILNRYFGLDLAMLPDESYIIVERNGHRIFEQACISIGECSDQSGAP
jgi:uncharacterized membrane protein YGL010W